MHTIHLLSDLLINQIAAGEVVQRPASVVKELLDNAIDAGGKNIKIVIKDAGKQLIQVIDDGIGMGETDARICFEKHTTSKIAKTDDLFKIQTMGFRGEAMASIAAVAQVEMETRLHEAPTGVFIAIEGSKIKKQEAIATPPGTKVSVKNLFYNVPARRNFLKSNPVEFKHILEEVQHAALARTEIGWRLYHNDMEIYKLSPEKLSHRIVHLFGKSYKKQLIPCKETTNIVTIEGYIGKPEQAKKTRGEQFLFVNQRFIKSPFLSHAIKNAYERLLPSDGFPFYALYLTIDPQWIDINVHPTKTEIKFQDEKALYVIVQAAVKKSLATHHVADSLDFEQDTNFSLLRFTNPIQLHNDPTHSEKERNYTQFKTDSPSFTSPKGWQGLFTDPKDHSATRPPTLDQTDATLQNQHNAGTAIQLYTSYIIVQVQSGALLIDQQAAHERVLYDRFMDHFQNKSGASQQLLMPEHLALNPVDYMVLLENKAILRALGFIIDPFGESTIIIHGCPAELSHHAPKQLLEGLIEQLKWNNSNHRLETSESFIRALAKKASIAHGTKLNGVEIDALLAQLFSSSNTMYTPDGKKICVMLSKDGLGALLK
ncbi:MAG: DNA mismatch repair endonuclease MutL [Candidatus Cardinium sp.]|uniref:DNA mismatch repair endonuclease MutL n=1 Tax=Cardinium endosymbiont of Dermatophagoides farinae TaxID=2597823 RepID=UPI00118436F1|nr:DNA mismatch repair endonuclease MutL [Cardinium endosymbiont of Dermatophagoides farinae]TSJ81237.1 DNA mismatch repair endonuclease MutL [Cardinium endosymbiont of Dermatophagoides farinae]UWW97290.1 MAG: DNA mismatch repair endonuclease MutL [Candidatus Cardinium sp.]